MTWQVINVEPSHGICDQCKRHDCGIVDGQHKWILTGMEDRFGDRLVIGFNCAKLWAQNLGIGKEVTEVEVLRGPSDDELLHMMHRALEVYSDQCEGEIVSATITPEGERALLMSLIEDLDEEGRKLVLDQLMAGENNGDNDSRVDADSNQPDAADPAPDRRRKANQGASKGQGTRQRTKRAN